MRNTKFAVKVDRGGERVPQYVRRLTPSPVLMTVNIKLALLMGKFTAEDVAQSMRNPRRVAELVSVRVGG